MTTAIERRKARELKAKMQQRREDADEDKRRAREKHEEEALAREKELKKYRDMAAEVAEYFAHTEDFQLEQDLKKARWDFYRHVRINIVDKEDR